MTKKKREHDTSDRKLAFNVAAHFWAKQWGTYCEYNSSVNSSLQSSIRTAENRTTNGLFLNSAVIFDVDIDNGFNCY